MRELDSHDGEASEGGGSSGGGAPGHRSRVVQRYGGGGAPPPASSGGGGASPPAGGGGDDPMFFATGAPSRANDALAAADTSGGQPVPDHIQAAFLRGGADVSKVQLHTGASSAAAA